MRTTIGILGTLGLLTVGALAVQPVMQNPPVVHPNTFPPDHLWDLESPRLRTWSPSEHQTGVVTYDTVNRSVDIMWGGPVDTAAGDLFTKFSDYQSIPFSFYVTDYVIINRRTIIAGGANERGDTFVNVATFAWPNPMPTPGIGASGQFEYEMAIPRASSIRSILPRPLIAPNGVRSILPVMLDDGASPLNVLVLFDTSSELYQINLKTGATTLVSSPTVAGTLPAIPQLDVLFEKTWAKEHSTEGFVYVYGKTDTKTLVLLDADKDGVIEGVDLIDDGGWDASPYGDYTQYVFD